MLFFCQQEEQMYEDTQKENKSQQGKRHKRHIEPACHCQRTIPIECEAQNKASGQQDKPPGKGGQKAGPESREIPWKHLKQQVRSGIVIIVKGSQNMLFAAIVERLQRLIEERGYAFLIYYISEQDNEVEQAWQICRERHPSGILFLGSDLEFFRERFSQIPVPCVLVTNSGRELGFENLSSVSTDDEAAALAAVNHLISLGHTRIGILGGFMEKSRAAHTRYAGCVRAFAEHGMSFSVEEQYEPAVFAMSEGYKAMGCLLDKMPDLTAVFAMADVLAVGAIRAVRDRGFRIPEEVSMVGFDGIELGSYLTPSLTTIRQDRERIADRSVELLLSQIEDRVKPEHELVPFRIISGESVRRL